MLMMDTVDEVSSPKSSDSTPLPRQVGEFVAARAVPTPTVVLGLIAKAAGEPWFPSQHAGETGTDRDSLDEPLTQLRIAGLIRIATWVRSVGQGYVLTPTGEKALASGAEIPPTGKTPEPLSSESFAAIPDDQTMPLELQSNPILEEGANWLPIDPRPPVVVPVLLIANVLWYFVGLVAAIKTGHTFWTFIWSGNPDIAHRFGSVAGTDLLHGEWWRLLTSCFVHGNCLHLVVILFALAMIGPLAELVWGRRRFAIIYLLSGLAGSSLAMTLHPQDALVGASGAIWGVLLSLVVWFVIFRTQLPMDVAMDACRRLTLVIVINVIVSFVPGISWQSHLGGAVAGFAAAWLLNAVRVGDLVQQRIALGLLFGLPVFCVGGIVVVMGRGENWLAYRDRLAQEQSQRAADAAGKSFDQEVRPLLIELNPRLASEERPAVAPHLLGRGIDVQLQPISEVQLAAVVQLLKPPERRKAARLTEIKARLADLRTLANRAIQLLSTPPVGVELIDRTREHAREFAEASSQSNGLLLEMLNADKIPDEAAWDAWGTAKRKSETLWLPLIKQ